MNAYALVRRAALVGLVVVSVGAYGCGEESSSGPAVSGSAGVGAPPEAAPVATPQSTVTEGPQATPPAGFPAELIYPESQHERAATTPNELHLASRSKDDAAKVTAFYERALPPAGFKPVSVLRPDTATTIVTGTKGDRIFSATVRVQPDGVRIELAHKLHEEM